MRLTPVDAPVIPTPTQQYSASTEATKANVLRLYFNRIAAFTRAIACEGGGTAALCTPHLLRYSTQSVTPGADTPTKVLFEQVYVNNGFADATGKLKPKYSGIYSVQFTLAVQQDSSSTSEIDVWLVKNGDAIPYTGQRHSLAGKHLTTITYNFSIDILPEDELSFWWSTNSAAVSSVAIEPSGTFPGAASAILAVQHTSTTGA